MIDADKRQFAEAIAGAHIAARAQPPTQDELRIMWAGLLLHPIERVLDAVQRHMLDPDRGRFAPRLADIVHQLTDDAAGLRGWSRALDAARSVGSYQSVCFDDPAISICIRDMGGWIRFCALEEAQQKFAMHEFAKRYASAARNNERLEGGYLLGIVDGERMSHGLPVRGPVLLGNPALCRQLIAEAPAVIGIGATAIAKLLEIGPCQTPTT